MNSVIFNKWVEEQFVPAFPPKCLVMDNASYHSVIKEGTKAPTSATRKGDMQKWLKDKKNPFDGKMKKNELQLTLVISNLMGPWKKFESTVVRLKRSYEDTGSVVCLTTKGRQHERNFEELKPASHVPILGTILNIFDVFVAVFFSPLNSLNLVKRLITSRYLFLCE
jgi:hypothetical protein